MPEKKTTRETKPTTSILYTGCRSLGTLCPRCYYGKREEVRLRVEMVGESAVSTCGSCGYEVKDR